MSTDDQSHVRTCACGCGQIVKNRFAQGHNHRGTKHSEDWKNKQAEGLKKAWADGKFKDAKPRDMVAFAEKLRGKKRNPVAIEATRAGVTKAWERGAYNKPETVTKRLENLARLWKTNKGASAETMNAIRAKRDLNKLRPIMSKTMKANVERFRADGTMQKNCDRNRKRLTGGNGLGCNVRGSLDHTSAKTWRIRSPIGEIFEFTNCREWVRKNLHRFHDYRPESRMPFSMRVAFGLKNIRNPKHPNASTHYQGWTTLAVCERGDLLGRDEAKLVLLCTPSSD